MAFTLEQVAFHLMRKVFQQHTARWQQQLPDLTKPQYAVLRAIAQQPGIEQIQLTEAALSSKATLAEMLARLETRGLLRRETDPADKRRRFIYLTDEGDTLLNTRQSLANAVDDEFLNRLLPAEREQLAKLLTKMMDNPEKR